MEGASYCAALAFFHVHDQALTEYTAGQGLAHRGTQRAALPPSYPA